MEKNNNRELTVITQLIVAQAKLTKYDGTTGEIISTRNTLLTRAEIIESLKRFWDYVVLEFDEDATMANVYNKKGDEHPVFTFEICDL